MRTRWTIFALFLAVLVMSFFPAPRWGRAAETEAERTAALVEGAKKEGRLIWYSSLNVRDSDGFLKRFVKKYPFIATELYRAGSEKLLTKIMAEAASKRIMFDVVLLTGQETIILQRKGLFAKYLSPERKFYPEGLKDPEGYWTDTYLNLNVLAYNTRLVPPRDVPKNYQDLLNSRWRGKIAADPKAFEWFAAMLKMMGEEKGLDYMRKLGDQNLKFYSSRTLNAQMVSAGEAEITIAVYNNRVEVMKAEGAPIEWFAFEPIVPEIHPIAVSARAAHPNTAKLFVDFMLSREGQEMVASLYRIPSRNDVDPVVPRLKAGLKVLPFDPTIMENYNRYVNLYRTVLMKK